MQKLKEPKQVAKLPQYDQDDEYLLKVIQSDFQVGQRETSANGDKIIQCGLPCSVDITMETSKH